MPSHDFECACGVRERWFPVERPLSGTPCPDCGEPLILVFDRVRTGIGGDDWFNNAPDAVVDRLELQLGERPRSATHLRQIEKRLKLERNFGDVRSFSEVVGDQHRPLIEKTALSRAIEKMWRQE